MSLPEVCPLDGKSGCKTNACYLYHIDWRSGEENCSIGYGATKKSLSKADPLQDTYVQNTSIRLGIDIQATAQTRYPVRNVVETVREKPVRQTPVKTETVREEIVTSDRNTTVIQSGHSAKEMTDSPSADVGNNKNKKKGKSIDDVMDLDLPDDYEKDFWS